MRKFCLLLALACACSPLFAEKTAPLGAQKVLWLGDSITQAGDYVTIVEYYLNREYPSTRFDFNSIGLSSENTSCLTEKDHPFPRPCLSERLGRAEEARAELAHAASLARNTRERDLLLERARVI